MRPVKTWDKGDVDLATGLLTRLSNFKGASNGKHNLKKYLETLEVPESESLTQKAEKYQN